MLYKKYHRNYIKQFRVGTEFSYRNFSYRNDLDGTYTVRKEAFIDNYIEEDYEIMITSGDGNYWTLVFPDGRIDCKIKIEKDAI